MILTAVAVRVGRRAVVALWRKDFANMVVREGDGGWGWVEWGVGSGEWEGDGEKREREKGRGS